MKRTMVIGLLCISMMMFLQPQAMAWNFQSGGALWGSYKAFFVVTGGQKPGTVTTFVSTTAAITQASLACVNPGSKKVDVRNGKGGITVELFTNLGDQNESYDQRGKFELTTQSVCATATIRDPTDNQVIIQGECESDTFNEIWSVDSTYCRNDNWVPHQYMIQKMNLTGEVLTDCEIEVDADGNPVLDTNENPQLELDSNGDPTCSTAAQKTFYCETLEDTRTLWPGKDGIVIYTCN